MVGKMKFQNLCKYFKNIEVNLCQTWGKLIRSFVFLNRQQLVSGTYIASYIFYVILSNVVGNGD